MTPNETIRAVPLLKALPSMGEGWVGVTALARGNADEKNIQWAAHTSAREPCAGG